MWQDELRQDCTLRSVNGKSIEMNINEGKREGQGREEKKREVRVEEKQEILRLVL